jgi:hypothetical protein
MRIEPRRIREPVPVLDRDREEDLAAVAGDEVHQ